MGLKIPSHLSTKTFFLKYWGPVLLYAICIVYLSSRSDPDTHLPSFLFGLSDKLLHGIEFGIFGILLYRAFRQVTSTTNSIGLAIVCVVAFGLSDEIHQWFVPRRQADFFDVLADTLGAACMVLGWVYVTEKKLYPSNQPQGKA